MFNKFHLEGIACFNNKRYEEAIRLFHQAIAEGSESTETYFYLGKCYFFHQETSKATTICYLEKYLQYYENSENHAYETANIAFAYNLLGRCYQDIEEHTKAQDFYIKATEKDPFCGSAWNDRGLLCVKLAMDNLSQDLEKSFALFQDAFAFLKNAVKICPNNPIFWHSLASAHEHYVLVLNKKIESNYFDPKSIHKNFKLAILNYKKALIVCASEHIELENSTIITSLQNLKNATTTNLAECLAQSGHHYYKAKEYTKARKLYLQTLELDPEHVIAINQVGMTFFEQKEFVEARNYFFKVLEKVSTDKEKADVWTNITYTYQSEKCWIFPHYGSARH